jgi:elongation factor G
MTAGEGRYTLLLSHYEAVPPHTQSALVGAYKAGDEAE